ncbi:hypothetical protein MD484_g5071, partial [Candolleomyces efflorescens]
MAENTRSSGDNRGLLDIPEQNTPISSRAATAGDDTTGPSNRNRVRALVDKGKARMDRGVAKVERKLQKAQAFMGWGKPKNQMEGGPRPHDAAEGSSNVRAIVIAMGTLKTALGIAATLVPDPFKGPAEALLKMVDVIEVWLVDSFHARLLSVAQQVNSTKEEVRTLKERCNLLGSSIVNAIGGKDIKFISVDLRDSIGRLVLYASFFELHILITEAWLQWDS